MYRLNRNVDRIPMILNAEIMLFPVHMSFQCCLCILIGSICDWICGKQLAWYKQYDGSMCCVHKANYIQPGGYAISVDVQLIRFACGFSSSPVRWTMTSFALIRPVSNETKPWQPVSKCETVLLRFVYKQINEQTRKKTSTVNGLWVLWTV